MVQRRWCGVAGHDESREAGKKMLLVRKAVAIVWMRAQGWRRATGATRLWAFVSVESLKWSV